MNTNLPSPRVEITCNHCLDELYNDGDGYTCHACQLRFDPDPFAGEPGEFLDEEASPCGATPTLRIEAFELRDGKPGKITRDPCALPSGHRSPHLYPETFEIDGAQA